MNSQLFFDWEYRCEKWFCGLFLPYIQEIKNSFKSDSDVSVCFAQYNCNCFGLLYSLILKIPPKLLEIRLKFKRTQL